MAAMTSFHAENAVLPSGECTRSVYPAHMQQRPPVPDPSYIRTCLYKNWDTPTTYPCYTYAYDYIHIMIYIIWLYSPVRTGTTCNASVLINLSPRVTCYVLNSFIDVSSTNCLQDYKKLWMSFAG